MISENLCLANFRQEFRIFHALFPNFPHKIIGYLHFSIIHCKIYRNYLPINQFCHT